MSKLLDKIFSQEIEETEDRLYSTGSDMLDELLTKAYSDGYEEAQRIFFYQVKKDDNSLLAKFHRRFLLPIEEKKKTQQQAYIDKYGHRPMNTNCVTA